VLDKRAVFDAPNARLSRIVNVQPLRSLREQGNGFTPSRRALACEDVLFARHCHEAPLTWSLSRRAHHLRAFHGIAYPQEAFALGTANAISPSLI